MNISQLHKHVEALQSEIDALKEIIATGSDKEAESAMWRAEELECEIRSAQAEILSRDMAGEDWYDWS